ncbi:mitochondrial carrier pet8 [Trichoderma arundinaceum]|uniref:Mitochondrial carrier pet8 n=1 Tax=Trichoderma arundinaceum TaxID=490622 RepID=A0A395NUZ6_TRIAR|nr:mitochondrial carrier pet8 [Trichoderma arundinaceum]
MLFAANSRMMYSRSLAASRAARGAVAATNRGFAFSVTKRLGLKESSNQTGVDYDMHKKDSLAKQKKGSGHWKPELASDSEEAVKADRASRDMHEGELMKALQERTKKAAEETSKAGTSMRDGL